MSIASVHTTGLSWERLTVETVMKFKDDKHTWKKINDKQMVSVYEEGVGNWVPDGTPAISYTPAWNVATAEIVFRPPIEELGPLVPEKTFMFWAGLVALGVLLAITVIWGGLWLFYK